MADRPQCTPLTAWNELAPFREVFLLHLTEPDDSFAFRRLGGLLFEMTLESCHLWPAQQASPTEVNLRAVAEDLRHCLGYLGWEGQSWRLSSLAPHEAQLSRKAAHWARQLGQLVAAIEAEVSGS